MKNIYFYLIEFIVAVILVLLYYKLVETRKIKKFTKDNIPVDLKLFITSQDINIKKISYVSDAENIKQYDICVKKGYDNYSECICFHVEFYIDGEGIISNGWTLARTQNGRWKSVFSPW